MIFPFLCRLGARPWLLALCSAVFLLGSVGARAGGLTREQMQQRVGDSFLVGEKLTTLPVWPVYQRNLAASGKPALQAYAFETIDIEPVAGYGGKPINMLVVMSPSGKFLDVRLLSHNEPIFQSPERNALLADFASQYIDLTVQHQIQVLTPKAKREADDQKATLHGVTAGTVSATAMDRSLMEAAAQVAYARLDDPGTRAQVAQAKGADDQYERMGFNQLLAARLVQPFSLSNREVQGRFTGTPAEGQDAEGRLQPNGLALDLVVMLPGLPQVGRNVLDAAGWRQVRALRESGIGVVGVLDSSRYTAIGSADLSGGHATRLVGVQGGKRFDLTAVPYTHSLRMSGQRSGVGSHAVMRLFATAPGASFDLRTPLALEMRLSRAAPVAGQARAEATWTHTLTIPEIDKWQPVRETPAWWRIWVQRKVDLLVLGIGLVVLAVALARQRWLSAKTSRLTWFRLAYLAFTLGFIGWAAQGQLTIVNLTSLASAVLEGRSGEFLMSDPMAICLWAFVGVSLLVWGRGTFCGWLCPFGAFQELLSQAAKWLGLKPRQFHRRVDGAMKGFKYLVLGLIVASVLMASPWTDTLVEVEPFKTSISMGFQRDWPYVAWAMACLGLSLAVFRGYCRYICPLGAALAIAGRLRVLNWIPRRAECGTPCQTCRHGCAYQAIEPQGRIDYTECFQCLDCVDDYQNVERCLPLVRQTKAQKKVIPVMAVASHG